VEVVRLRGRGADEYREIQAPHALAEVHRRGNGEKHARPPQLGRHPRVGGEGRRQIRQRIESLRSPYKSPPRFLTRIYALRFFQKAVVVKNILHRRAREVRRNFVRCSNADFSALSANSAVKIAVRHVHYLVEQYSFSKKQKRRVG
jgi:hypothetical protein